MAPTTDPKTDGLDRRTMLRRAGLSAGALAWSTPLVQSISSPAFAAGSEPPVPGFAACVAGDGKIIGGVAVAGRLSSPLQYVSYRIAGPLCCEHPGVELHVTALAANVQPASPHHYVFDADLQLDCTPELTCSGCPTVISGSATGRSVDSGTAATIAFRFENAAPTPGQRGEQVDVVDMTIKVGSSTITAGGAPQPDPQGTSISCSSC